MGEDHFTNLVSWDANKNHLWLIVWIWLKYLAFCIHRLKIMYDENQTNVILACQRKKFSSDIWFFVYRKNEILRAYADCRNKIIWKKTPAWPWHAFCERGEPSSSFIDVDLPNRIFRANKTRDSASRALVKYFRLIAICSLKHGTTTEPHVIAGLLEIVLFFELNMSEGSGVCGAHGLRLAGRMIQFVNAWHTCLWK